MNIGRVQAKRIERRAAVERAAHGRDAARLIEIFERARDLLDVGESQAARDALRVLLPAHFGEEARRAEGLLALLRDRRATDQEIRLILVVARRLVES